MGMESFNAPQPQKQEAEKPRMTFGERIGKGKSENDPKWEAAGQKIDLINEAMRILGEKNNSENTRRMKEATEKDQVFEMLGKEEYDALTSGYDALKDLYMAEEPEQEGPEKWEKQKAAQKALEIAEKIVGGK